MINSHCFCRCYQRIGKSIHKFLMGQMMEWSWRICIQLYLHCHKIRWRLQFQCEVGLRSIWQSIRLFWRWWRLLLYQSWIKMNNYNIDGIVSVSGWCWTKSQFLNVPFTIAASGERPVDGFQLSVNCLTDNRFIDSECKGGYHNKGQDDEFVHLMNE